MRDGQNPRPELGLFPPEGGKVAGNLEEHLAGQVLGLVGAPAPQVPEHERSKVAVQSCPRPLGSKQGGLEHLGEALPQTHLDVPPLAGHGVGVLQHFLADDSLVHQYVVKYATQRILGILAGGRIFHGL